MLLPRWFCLSSLIVISLLCCYFLGNNNAQINPVQIAAKALLCLDNKFIYSGCDEEYRLDKSGDLHIPCEAANKFCYGPCLSETRTVLKCIDNLASGFIFLNKATTEIIRNALESGCSYTPLRGLFVVGKDNEPSETCNLISSDTTAAGSSQYAIGIIVVFCSLIILAVL